MAFQGKHRLKVFSAPSPSVTSARGTSQPPSFLAPVSLRNIFSDLKYDLLQSWEGAEWGDSG